MAAGRPVSMTNAYANLSTTQAGPVKQGDAVADVTAYTAHASGAVAVTSAAATDLDTTAAQVALLTTKLNALLAELRQSGAIDT